MRRVLPWCAALGALSFAYGDSQQRFGVLGAPHHDVMTHWDEGGLHADQPDVPRGGTLRLNMMSGYGLTTTPSTIEASLPAPGFVWDPATPTVDAIAGTAYTVATGASPVGTVNTHFCPSENYADLSTCLKAGKIGDVAGAYGSTLTAPGSAFDLGSGVSWTLAYIVMVDEHDTAGTNALFTDGSSVIGTFPAAGNTHAGCYSNLVGTATQNSTVLGAAYGYSVCLLSYDVLGNQTMYALDGGALGISTNQDVAAGGNIGTAGNTTLGGTEASALVRAWFWPGAAFTQTQSELFLNWARGVLDTTGNATGVLYKSGHAEQSCWIDDQIHTVPGGVPLRGCQPNHDLDASSTVHAPGWITEWVTATSGPVNALLYSRDLSTGWTAAGSGTVTCAQANTPYAFGRNRKTCLIADDDIAAVEKISQTFSMAAAATNDKYTLCLYSATPSGTSQIDVQIAEATGCGGNTTNWAAQTVNTTWDTYRIDGTVVDGACTDMTVSIGFGDITDVASTGSALVLANMFLSPESGGYCPNLIETTSAAIESGDQIMKYTTSAPFTVGAVTDNTTVATEFTLLTNDESRSTARSIASLSDGSNSNRAQLGSATASTFRILLVSSSGIMDTPLVALSGTSPGERMSASVRWNFTTDNHSVSLSDEDETKGASYTVSTLASPTGLTLVDIGITGASGAGPEPMAFYKFTVRTP